jgi:hypothetical protein
MDDALAAQKTSKSGGKNKEGILAGTLYLAVVLVEPTYSAARPTIPVFFDDGIGLKKTRRLRLSNDCSDHPKASWFLIGLNNQHQ